MTDVPAVPAPADDLSRPPDTSQSAVQWAKRNLFNSPMNSVITILFAPIALYLLYRLFRFVFITGRWDAVDRNLELFMIGQYPREERWRIVAQLLTLSGSVGVLMGALRSSARDTAIETGEPFEPTSWKEYLSSYWAVAAFIGLILVAFVDTAGPWLITGGVLVIGFAMWAVTSRIGGSLRPYAYSVAALGACASFQVLSGTGGWAWGYTTLALIPALGAIVGSIPRNIAAGLAGLGAVAGIAAFALRPGLLTVVPLVIGLYAAFIAFRGDKIDGGRAGSVVVAGFAVFFLFRAIDHSGIDWSEWGGFHLNLVATVGGILLAFPLGVLLALGRRSDLPAVRMLSIGYIEFFRGAPLITFLLAAQFFLGFFLNTDNPLSLVTRATVAIMLFSAAYIAEIIRGGLQAVPKGQIEAGQAQGLSQPKIMRLIVLPQALRAVIPAMVGQFISLFKDTSLFTIIALPEFLTVRELVHAQADFRGFGIAETLTFVAAGFGVVAFSMSRESQRLERRLGVGQR